MRRQPGRGGERRRGSELPRIVPRRPGGRMGSS